MQCRECGALQYLVQSKPESERVVTLKGCWRLVIAWTLDLWSVALPGLRNLPNVTGTERNLR